MSRVAGFSVVCFGLLVAGCVEPSLEDVEKVAPLPTGLIPFALTDPSGDRLPLALMVGRDASGQAIWFASTDLEGKAEVSASNAVTIDVFADGSSYSLDGHGTLTPSNATSPLQLTKRVAMPNPTFPAQAGTTCTDKTDGDTGCGLDEPSIVVDARGWIYYTAACCFLVSSPVFVSKDHGATFTPLANPFKDGYGNEGDLAIDDQGNLYYMDIDLATFGIARWNPDLSPAYGYRRPGEPLVDRPWIRAGSAGVVHAIYNTGQDTVYYRSTDFAQTFEPTPSARLGTALGGAYSDVRRGIVGMVGGGNYVESSDGGAHWGEPTKVPGCEAQGVNDERASVDAAGTVWFQLGSCVTGRTASGSWTPPVKVAPEGMDIHFAWVAAAAPGSVAVGYYGKPGSDEAKALGLDADSWYLFLAFSADAASQQPHWANVVVDPEPVGVGSLGRALGDFMNTAIGPDGAIHLAYARNPEMDDSATAVYIGTNAIPLLAPAEPLVGPFESA